MIRNNPEFIKAVVRTLQTHGREDLAKRMRAELEKALDPPDAKRGGQLTSEPARDGVRAPGLVEALVFGGLIATLQSFARKITAGDGAAARSDAERLVRHHAPLADPAEIGAVVDTAVASEAAQKDAL